MSPQLVDFDADGREDMVMGTFEGVAFVVPGTESGYGEPERILDAQGRHVLLSQFWNRETNEWDETDRSPRGRRNPDDHCISAVAFDWDDDGDLDLLLGAKEGRLYLHRNEGEPGEPSFTGVNEPIEGFEVPGGLTAPRLVDWDRDGLTDLLCGSFKGGVFLYRNVGERGAPSFGAPVALAEPPPVGLPEEPIGPASGFYAEAVDYDGDGDLDLLVGGESTWKREARTLTQDEERRASELEAKIEALEVELRALYREEPEGEQAEAEHVAKIRALRETVEETTALLDELVPQEKDAYFVWLYRRVGGAGRSEIEVPVDEPSEDAPVRSGMAAEREGDALWVAVRLRLASGWHVYDGAGPGRYAGTKLALELPAGLVADGGWEAPPSAYDSESKLGVWNDDVVFRRRIRVEEPPPQDAEIACTLTYQACNADICLPPTERRLSIAWSR